MKIVYICAIIVSCLFSGCTGTGAGDTNVTCINSQAVPITLPSGQEPLIEGDGAVVEDIDNGNGTHTVTISGCDFEITGDVNTSSNSNVEEAQ